MSLTKGTGIFQSLFFLAKRKEIKIPAIFQSLFSPLIKKARFQSKQRKSCCMHLGITELRTKAKLVLSAQLALSQWKDVNPRALLIDVCCFRRRGEIALDLLKGHSKRFLFTFAGMLVTPKKWIFVNALKNHRKKINLSVIYYMYIFPLKLALVKNL